jgi:hypothetical protein
VLRLNIIKTLVEGISPEVGGGNNPVINTGQGLPLSTIHFRRQFCQVPRIQPRPRHTAVLWQSAWAVPVHQGSHPPILQHFVNQESSIHSPSWTIL